MLNSLISNKSKDKTRDRTAKTQSAPESKNSLPKPSSKSTLSLSSSSAASLSAASSTSHPSSSSSIPRSSSFIPSSAASSHAPSQSLASEHLRRVASSATLRSESKSPPSSSTSTHSRKRTASKAPSLAASFKPSLSLSPSWSALAKPSTSSVHAQADSGSTLTRSLSAASPSNLSLTSPTASNLDSVQNTTPSSSVSADSAGSVGTIRKLSEPRNQDMKRKADDRESYSNPTSANNASPPITSADPLEQCKEVPVAHLRQRLANSSAARPQTWFGRLGGGSLVASSVSNQAMESRSEGLMEEGKESLGKSLALQEGERTDEGRTLRSKKKSEVDVDGNGLSISPSTAILSASENHEKDTDVTMKDLSAKGEDCERFEEQQSRESAANRASWFWTRAASISNNPQASSSKLRSDERDEKLERPSEPPESREKIGSSASPHSSSPSAARDAQFPQLDLPRQATTSYVSPLRKLWGGGPAVAEESGSTSSDKVSEDGKDESHVKVTPVPPVAATPQSAAGIKASQEDSIDPFINQQGWFWSRRAPPPAELQSSSTFLPPQDESKAPTSQAKEALPSSGSQLIRADSVSDSASQGYSYSSYLASWIPTWKSEMASSDQPKQSVDTRSEPESQISTPAQRIRAEALARPEIQREPAASSSSALVPNASDAVLNAATKKGWIAFFGSAGANKPRSVPPMIEDKPESMYIDMDQASAANVKDVNPSGTLTPRSVVSASRDSIASAAATSAANGKAQAPGDASDKSLKIKHGSKEQHTPIPSSSNSNASKAPKHPAPPNSRPITPLTNDKAAVVVVRRTAAANGDPNFVRAKNLVLPTFEDTFCSPPRSLPPKAGVLTRTLAAVGSYLLSIPPDAARLRTAPRKRKTSSDLFPLEGHGDKDLNAAVDATEQQQRLPRAWGVIGEKERESRRGCENVKKVVVIGVHGWFSQSIFKTVLGEPTGTSMRFATMMASSVRKHFKEADLELNPEAVTIIPLQGDGRVGDRVDRLFSELLSRPEWVKDIASADAMFVAAHSQGAIVSTHLLARLIEQRHLDTRKTKVCLLAMCGIHHGPFAHLRSTVTSSFINYFETAAAKELFEFQSSNAQVSKHYVSSLNIALKAGVKFCYVASVDDQVVPLESALNSSSSHPSILRALYIDGQSFPKTDFLTNLLVFCVKVRNSGLGDHNLLALLSSSVAGSLYSGLGHSLVYNEPTVYDLSTRYLLETTHPSSSPTTRSDESNPPDLRTMAFEAQKWNPYSLPWALRGLLEDQDVRDLFHEDAKKLLSDYHDWNPTTKVLKDLQWRLEPIKMIRPSHSSNSLSASSKTVDSASNSNNSKL